MSKMLPVLVILGLCFTAFIFLFDYLGYKDFSIQTEKDCVSTPQVQDLLKTYKPNLITFSDNSFTGVLKSKYKCVDSVTYQKKFPSLKLDIRSNLPLARIEGAGFVVNSNLQAEEGTASASVPTLYLQQAQIFSSGQTVSDPETIFALNIIKNLKDSDFVVSNVRILDSQNIVVYNPQNAIAVFSSKIALGNQLSSLQSVLAKSRIDATKIAKIDLRFDKPVIVLK